MKKLISVVCALLMCMCAVGAYADSNSDKIFDIIKEGYQSLNVFGGVGIEWKISEDQTGFLKPDMTTDVNTLIRPYIYAITPENDQATQYPEWTMVNAMGESSYLLKLYSQVTTGENKVSLFNEKKTEQIDEFDPGNVDLDYYSYIADDAGKWELMFVEAYDLESNKCICDEVYAFCRFAVMRNDGLKSTMNVMLVDQDIVCRLVEATGVQSKYVKEWYLRYTQKDAEPVDLEKHAKLAVRIRESGDVNVRAKPDAESARVGKATAGKTYDCLSVADNGWYEIVLEDGTVGFVSQKLATMIE